MCHPCIGISHLIELEAPPGFEPGLEVLQTSALPLGDGADHGVPSENGEESIVPEGANR